MVSTHDSGITSGLRAAGSSFSATGTESRFERHTDEQCIFDGASTTAATQPCIDESIISGAGALPIILARVPVRVGSTVVTLELQGQNCGYTNSYK